MALLDRLSWIWRPTAQAVAPVVPTEADFIPDLPLRREAATIAVADRGTAMKEAGSMILPFPFGMGLDADDHLYRRLTGDAKNQRRDLAPLAQDRMIEISYYLWEQNCFARRLITLMTDLILGEGITVEATDPRNQDIIDQTWNHRVNQLAARVRQFYNSLSVNGELILPVAENPISGVPLLGFIDPYQVKYVRTLPDNILVGDVLVLKPNSGEQNGQELKIVRENPETGRLEGEVFYFAINQLPNSLRGRSDLMAVADWLDLYDQYMFGEVERLNLLSAFVYDLKLEGLQPDEIKRRVADFPKLKPGSVYGHNEKESLTAVTPDLKAQDRSEVARMLRIHIAGSMGYPVSYLGDIDSNRATIEGQNDITLKTPAARQKEFGGFIDAIVRYAIEHAQQANRALFRDVQQGYKIRMPEISAKDVSRVGQVIATVMSGMDVALNNKTMSRRAVVTVQAAIISHLGVKLDPQDVMDEADQDVVDANAAADQRQADMAAKGIVPPPNPNNPNPPIPPDDPAPTKESLVDVEYLDAMRTSIDNLVDRVEGIANRPAPAQHIHVPPAAPAPVSVHVDGATVNVPPAQPPAVTVNVEARKRGKTTLTRDDKGNMTMEEAGD